MHKTVRMLMLFFLSGLTFAQTLHSELGAVDYCYPYRHYGYPYEYRRAVSLFELPIKPEPTMLGSGTKPVTDNPLEKRLARQMEAIIAAVNPVSTNTGPFNMAPGLAPVTR